MRPGIGPSSFYDPISAGSSRRSSQLSTATTGGISIPPPPPSHLLAGQLQKLQSSPSNNPNLVLQPQNVSLQQTAIQQTWLSNKLPENISQSTTTSSGDTRRMSEPCHTLTDRKSPPPRPASVTLSPLKGPVNSTELHPNQAVVLDEVGEGEMVENKLVIPDEMVHYLSQVADNQNSEFNPLPWNESSSQNGSNGCQKPVSSPGRMMPSPSLQMLHSPSLNQVMPSPSSHLNHILPSPQGNNVLSPVMSSPSIIHSHNMPSSNNLNQMMASPAPNLNQIMPSPASATNLNQMLPSPAPMSQMMPPSPASNLNQMISSPAPNMGQMMASPASNMNQMMPSPAPNMNQMMPSPSPATFGNIQNPLMSPGPNMNQIIPSPNANQMVHSPASNPMTQIVHSPASNMNQMVLSPGSNRNVPSPMSIRCQNQLMSPNATNINRMVQSPIHGLQSPNSQLIAPQNCNVMVQNPIAQNGHLMMQNSQVLGQNMNQCYNRTTHNVCYMQHGNNWDHNGQNQQNRCLNQTQMQPANNYNICHTATPNTTYTNMCRPHMQNSTYVPSNIPMQSGNSCTNHLFPNVCNQNGYVPNGCQQPKHANNYICNNTYTSMQNSPFNCEPLPSPAMATPAPNDMVVQPQQAQMARPCSHFDQNCYRQTYNNQCVNNPNDKLNQFHNCNNCINRKVSVYNNHGQTKCFHQCSDKEIQCKDISQSQMSPGIINTNNQNKGQVNQTINGNPPPPVPQPLGMRQEAYQRTLEYVQNCQSWVGSPDVVSSSTHPLAKCSDTSSNMVVNDMTSSLSSLLEENRYLQMIQ